MYHDLGNMNFTFLINKEEYDLDRQLQVIIGAMEILGLKAEKSGRNDILIDGKKFSGNAFYEQEKHCYHHGTIMVGVNMETLSRYLTVSKDKLKSKGVDSVKSRVTNLRDYLPELTMEELKVALKQSFEKVYGLKVRDKKIEDLDTGVIAEREKFFSSWNWLYGRKIDFQYDAFPTVLDGEGLHFSLRRIRKDQGCNCMVGCTESGFHTYTSEVSERIEVQKGKYLYGIGAFLVR